MVLYWNIVAGRKGKRGGKLRALIIHGYSLGNGDFVGGGEGFDCETQLRFGWEVDAVRGHTWREDWRFIGVRREEKRRYLSR